jgi:diadenosine tetraphosphate (Ap4A) HIT family hydrolase
MCAEGRPDAIPDGLRFFVGECSDAYLHRHAPTAGYTVVIWRGRHVAEPTELTEHEWHAFWREVLAVARALEMHYEPAKMNYQLLGNGVPHLHVHLVLRHHDDVLPGRPAEECVGRGDCQPRFRRRPRGHGRSVARARRYLITC